jgi:hypothetical protein
MALVVLGGAVIRRDREAGPPLLILLLAVAGFVILSSMIKFSVFGSRYQLPFFVLLAPSMGFLVDRIRSSWIVAGLAVGLALTSNSWLLRLHERPLLVDSKGYSVATSPRESMYFTTGHALEGPYRQVTSKILEAGCSSVGVMLGGDAAEYPLWALLGAPRSDLEMEWIVGGTPSARYEDPTFEPCAVVCDSTCPAEWTTIRGLPFYTGFSGLRLFLRP